NRRAQCVRRLARSGSRNEGADACRCMTGATGNEVEGMSVRGPIMLGVEALALTDGDRARLADPRVGGVILFARNFSTSAQLRALTSSICAVRPELLIAVDHEGGRVQRFRT